MLAVDRVLRTMLQWSHVPKDVERYFVGEASTITDRLQWSHVPKDVERCLLVIRLSLLRMASMEPRPEGRGECSDGNQS